MRPPIPEPMASRHKTPEEQKLAAKNKRLAILLGLVALGFYAGFIMLYL